MLYEIDTSKQTGLNWRANGNERILQNVTNLISTWRYEVGYDRTKGLDPTILDKPMDEAIAMYTAEIYRLVETYEPRTSVISVTPTSVLNGDIQFKVVVEID